MSAFTDNAPLSQEELEELLLQLPGILHDLEQAEAASA